MKIRVLEVLATLRRAGAERVAVSIACGLDASRFDTCVVSLFDAFPGGFESTLAEHDVPVRHLGKRSGFDPRMWPRLAGATRAFRPDIVHTHSYVMRYALPAWALGARHAGLVHTVHNLAGREVDAIGRAIHRIAFRAGAVPVAISKEVSRSFRRVYGFEPAATIPNGADTLSGFRPAARETWRRAHGFAGSDVLIVSAARFEPQKDPLGLIEAFARALAGDRDCYLIMAGEGSLLEESRRLAERLGIASRVRFLGLCQDVPELLSACDLFVLSSKWEGASVAVIEAMAARLPVLATAVGGVPELVEDGVTGVLTGPGDPAALARTMAELARDPERRRRLGASAGRRAALFDQGAMVAAYAALFERQARRSWLRDH